MRSHIDHVQIGIIAEIWIGRRLPRAYRRLALLSVEVSVFERLGFNTVCGVGVFFGPAVDVPSLPSPLIRGNLALRACGKVGYGFAGGRHAALLLCHGLFLRQDNTTQRPMLAIARRDQVLLFADFSGIMRAI